jgi:hypothetical protein
MNCNQCGAQLPPGAANCPTCGAVTPYAFSGSGTSPYEMTAQVTPASDSLHPVATNYGAFPYGTTQENPYAQNPYDIPPPPPPPGRRRSMLIIIGVVALVLILAGGGLFAYLSLTKGSTFSPAPTPTLSASAKTAQAQAIATNISATQAAQANATLTAAGSAILNPYAPYNGTLSLDDPMQDNSKGVQWDESQRDVGTCRFIGGVYHTIEGQRYLNDCIAAKTNFSNFAFQVQMTIVKGDSGGLVFRADSANSKFYYFQVNQSGSYGLYAYNNTVQTLAEGFIDIPTITLNQPYLVAVVARGQTIDLYVNLHLITSVTDGTFSHGQIGVAATFDSQATEVMYSNVKVWTF